MRVVGVGRSAGALGVSFEPRFEHDSPRVRNAESPQLRCRTCTERFRLLLRYCRRTVGFQAKVTRCYPSSPATKRAYDEQNVFHETKAEQTVVFETKITPRRRVRRYFSATACSVAQHACMDASHHLVSCPILRTRVACSRVPNAHSFTTITPALRASLLLSFAADSLPPLPPPCNFAVSR